MMKRIKIAGGLVVVAAVVILFGLMRPAVMQVSATGQNQAVSTISDVMPKDTSAVLGSDANPFTVLEIVPSKSLAQTGYLIPGCEPIDIDRLCKDGDAAQAYNHIFASSASGVATLATSETKAFIDQIPEGTQVTQLHGDDKVSKEGALNIASDLGITEGADWTTYNCWQTQWTQYVETGYYQSVEDNKGMFTLEDKTFTYVGKNKGNYNWIEAENTDNIETDYKADQVWTTREESHYYTIKEITITNNDLMIKDAFGTTSENFVSQVVTVTPDELNAQAGLDLIDQADLIVFRASSGVDTLDTLWKNYNKAGETLAQDAPTDFADSRIQMNWEAVMHIIRRQASSNPASMMIDRSAIDKLPSNNNIYKMFLMLVQFGPKTFLDLFEADITQVIENGVTTGSYSVKDGTNWKSDTFTGPNNINLQYAIVDWVSNGQNQVTGNLYVTVIPNVLAQQYSQANIYETKDNEELFDYLEERDGTRPESITPAQATAYILSEKNYKTKLNILEIEGCNEFLADSTDWKAYIELNMPWFKGDVDTDVTVTKMTTAEFNGNIDDLSATYDLILIRDSQNETNGGTGYNDAGLNRGEWVNGSQKGLIYTAIGDLVAKATTTNSRGNASNARYAAVDITRKKLNELRDYVAGGKPIVMASTLFSNNKPDTGKIDQDSNLYKLASGYKSQEEDTLLVEGANKNYGGKERGFINALRKAAGIEQCSISFYTADGGTGYPTEYTYQEASDGTIYDVSYMSGRTFTYQFRVNGVVGSTYTAKLFIDQDGDGVYDGSEKEKSKLEAIGVDADTIESEEIAGCTFTDIQTGTVVTTLEANRYYRLTRTVPNEFQGILPWKLEVTSTSNEKIRDSEIGYTAVKAKASDKVQVNVLQMNLSIDMQKTAAEQFKASGGGWNTAFLNFADTSEATGAKFKKYLSCVDEYNIKLSFQQNSDWYAKYGNNGTAGDTKEKRIAAWKEELDGYDMLILGFNDMCTFTSNDVFYEGFKYFQSQGKSIIMSHDMVSSADNYLDHSAMYNDYASELRTLVGQRKKYLNSDENAKNTDGSPAYSYETASSAGKSVSLLPDKTEYNRSGGDHMLSDPKSHAFTRTINGKEVYYTYHLLVDNVGQTASEYPDNAIRLLLNSYAVTTGAKRDRILKSSIVNNNSINWDNDYLTKYVGVSNTGQITEYPYNIPDVIQVGTTHSQYYALDMESATDGDVVTWYNLTDIYSEKYADAVKTAVEKSGATYSVSDADKGKGLFSSKDGDGQNNYYIYNKGNVTYTGLGHSSDYNSSKGLPDDEVKLFVNTMIAAFRFTAAKPYIDVTNESGSNNSNESIIYVDTDVSNISLSDDMVIPIEFQVNDDSFYDVADRKYYLRMSDVDGTTTTLNNRTLLKADATALSPDTANNRYNVTPADGVYTVNVTYGELREKGEIGLELVLTSEYQNNKNETVTTSSTKHITIMPMPLFSLN